MYSTLKRCTLLLALVALAAATIVGCNGSDVAENPVSEELTIDTEPHTPANTQIPADLLKELSSLLQLSEAEILDLTQELVDGDEIDLHTGTPVSEKITGMSLLGKPSLPAGCSFSTRIKYYWKWDENGNDWDVAMEFMYPLDTTRTGYKFSGLLRRLWWWGNGLFGRRPLISTRTYVNPRIPTDRYKIDWVLIGGGIWGMKPQNEKPDDSQAKAIADNFYHYHCR